MSLSVGQQLNLETFRTAYVITMFSIWGVGVDIPRLLLRYGKSYSQVIDIHSISMAIMGLLTILYVITYTVKFYTSPIVLVKTQLQLAQLILSFILVVTIIIQFILGYVTRAQMVRTRLSKNLFSVKRSHKVIGYFMWAVGKVLVSIQLKVYRSTDDLFKAWMFCLGGMILLMITIQIIYRSQTRTIIFDYPHKNINKHQKYHKQIFDCLVKGVDTFQNFKHLGVRYLLIDNCMYYIDENFLHPGGEYIFHMFNGKQINYLLRGTREIAPQYPRHVHTKYVMKYLQHRIIGQLPIQSYLINQKVSNEYVEWKIKGMRVQGVDGHMVTFQNQSGYVKQLLRVQNFGKYIMMSSPNQQILNKIERPYTLIISLCETQKKILDKFKQAYNFYYTGKCENTALLQKTQLPEVLSSKLTFFIKQYKQGLYTKFLFNSPPGKKYTMTGPYGSGLNMKSNSRGYYIMIGVGSGITPYVDLFNYLLQKTLIQLIAHKVGQSKARKVNSQGMNYSHLTDLKILFIGSFVSSKHFYFHDLVQDLYELNRVHKLNKFNVMLKYQSNEIESDVTMIKDSFDRSFFKSLLEEQNPDKIFYCGPSNIEYTMRKLQSQMDLKNIFYYV